MNESSFFSTTLPKFVLRFFVVVVDFGHFDLGAMKSHIFISKDDDEQFWGYFLAICISSFENALFRCLALLLSHAPLTLCLLVSLYILYANPLSEVHLAKILFHSLCFSFT